MSKEQKRKRGGGSSVVGYLCFLLVFFISAGVLAYPAVASWWNAKHQVKETEGYQTVVDHLSEQEYTEYWEQAAAYNEALLRTGTILTDPFDFEAAKEAADGALRDYKETLSFSEIMAVIEIPKIDVDLPVYHGTEKETLSNGIGHLEGSSLPVGGIGTHCILTGHTGLPGKKLFTDLTKLKKDDVFYIHVLDETLVYQVDDIAVVEPTELSKLVLDAEKDYVTLITCTPYGVNSHRLLVRGTRIYPEEMTEEERAGLEKAVSAKQEMSFVQKVELAAAGVSVLLFIVMLYLMISSSVQRRKKRKQHEET